jgi:ATP-binding cassette subfamily B protein
VAPAVPRTFHRPLPNERNGSFVSTLLRFQRTSLLGRSLPGTIVSVATIAVFLYGGEQIILGRMTMGTLVAFMAYHARLLSPVQNLLGLSGALSTARVSLTRVLELLDTAPEVTERPGAIPLIWVERGIEFSNVSLQHEGRPVLADVSFHIPAGGLTVIVGPSGAGKSTIADLMVRLLDPDSGTVFIDGLDARSIRLQDLRRTVVLIDQSPHLLHGTLFENIAYARPDTPRNEVMDAAYSAGLRQLLQGLPAGLDTVVGERGLTLSAGERQRVAIARAFLLDPQVLIVDEPSAALDPRCERELVENLRRVFRGKTLIVITHKPMLSAQADYVLRIENGRMIESGVLV